MAGFGSSEVSTPIFSGENYKFWRIKMVTTSYSKKKKKAEGSSEEEDDEKTMAAYMQDAKALETVELHEVLAILKSHEQRFDMHTVDATEKAFASFSVSSKGQQNRGNSQSSGLKSQTNWNLRGNHGSRRESLNITILHQITTSVHYSQQIKKLYKGKPKCYNCDKFGHLARECTAGKSVHKANCANQVEISSNLFYANCATPEAKVNGNWYIDSGCNNHMTGNVNLLVNVRTNVVGKVQMTTGDLVNVAGMGSLVIDTTKERKYIIEVMYLPGLKENLLSVGQMDENGYYLLFGGKHETFWELTGFGVMGTPKLSELRLGAIPGWVTHWEVAHEFPQTKS
ncbi:unnamed protein product [Prunus armeniaca]